MSLSRNAWERPVSPPQVWSDLPPDLQQRTLTLLVQLALHWWRHPNYSPCQEVCHVDSAPVSQDPS